MALCGLDLREHRREAMLVHWLSAPLLRFLLHCHSYCSYCQRGMWSPRCNLPCTSWPLVLEVLLWYSEEQWECALCSTQVGWCLVSVSSHLWPGSGCPWTSPQSQGEPVLCAGQCWNGHQARERWHSPRAVGGGFVTCWLLRGNTYTSLPLWLYLASLPVTHHFLGHHTD